MKKEQRQSSFWRARLQWSLVCVVIVVTVLVTYFPLFVGQVDTFHDVHLSNGVPARSSVHTSYISVLASTSSLLLDSLLEAKDIITGTKEISRFQSTCRLLGLFVVLWPALHAVNYSGDSIYPLLADAIIQKLLCFVLMLYGLSEINNEHWDWKCVMTVLGLASVGIILFAAKCYVDAVYWEPLLVLQYVFEGMALVVLAYRFNGTDSSEDTGLPGACTAFFSVMTILLVLLQASFDFSLPSMFKIVIVISNYLLVAACTLPVVMPGRQDRENVLHVNKLNEFRQSFMRYISHEIRTPMNVSTVGVAIIEDVLQSKELLDGELADIVEQTKRALSISTEILNDLLTFEKLNANAMTLEQTLECPVDFVLGTASLFEFQAREKGLAFQLPQPTPLLDNCFICIDTYKMSQVIRNMVSNALKFTPAGGRVVISLDLIPGKAEVKSPPRKRTNSMSKVSPTASVNKSAVTGLREWLRISVTDDGAGIAPENIGKLFQEIIQFDANRLQQGKGTGLGMFISKGIVELHDGTIGVHSEGLGKGCTFVVDLPLVRINSNFGVSKSEGCDTDDGKSSSRRTITLSTSQLKLFSEANSPAKPAGKTSSPKNIHSGIGGPVSHVQARVPMLEDIAEVGSAYSGSYRGRTISSDTQSGPSRAASMKLGLFHHEDSDKTLNVLNGRANSNNNLNMAIESIIGAVSNSPVTTSMAIAGHNGHTTPSISISIPASCNTPDISGEASFIMSSNRLNEPKVHTSRYVARRPSHDFNSNSDHENSSRMNSSHVVANNPSQPDSRRASGANVSINSLVPGIAGIVPISRCPSSTRNSFNNSTKQSTLDFLNDLEMGKTVLPLPMASQKVHTQFSTIDLRDYRILLVDDSAMNLKMMSLMIRKFGAECLDASNGDAAFKLVKSSLMNSPRQGSHIDMVIMDNNMDIMNGPQACRLMREAGFTGPIFGLTGDVSDSGDRDYLNAGANHILHKPLKIQEIVDVLTRCSV
jgi:signal transduction histidine kinase